MELFKKMIGWTLGRLPNVSGGMNVAGTPSVEHPLFGVENPEGWTFG